MEGYGSIEHVEKESLFLCITLLQLDLNATVLSFLEEAGPYQLNTLLSEVCDPIF